MSYTNDLQEVQVANTVDIASAADVATYAAGYFPFVVRSVTMVFHVAADATGAMEVDKRITAGSDTGRTAAQATINYTTTTGAQGKTVYADQLDVRVDPGEELVFQISDATPTAGDARVMMHIEIIPENPANESDSSETT